MEWLETEILKEAEQAAAFSLASVINATGVILHTNLGRAPLAPEAIAHLVEAAAGIPIGVRSGLRQARAA